MTKYAQQAMTIVLKGWAFITVVWLFSIAANFIGYYYVHISIYWERSKLQIFQLIITIFGGKIYLLKQNLQLIVVIWNTVTTVELLKIIEWQIVSSFFSAFLISFLIFVSFSNNYIGNEQWRVAISLKIFIPIAILIYR